jgi:hypothetical protein
MGNQQAPVVLQRQSEWNVGDILNSHFGNLNYLLRPASGDFELSAGHKVYNDNASLWKDIISETLTAYSAVTLRDFDLFPWLPRSLGLFHTPNAKWARGEALDYLDDRFGPAPIRRIDHAWELQEGQRGGRPEWGDYTLVFAPKGKASIAKG